MGLEFLLDTNVVSEPVRDTPNPSVMAMLKNHSKEIAISATVWHELQFGLQRLPNSKRYRTLQNYVEDLLSATVPILAYDQKAATWHGQERARLTNMGLTPAFADGQIAAVAFVNDLALVTANIKDFKNFDGLDLVNWHTDIAIH